MVGIVLVTHGKWGEALKASAEMLMGPCSRIECLSLEPEETVEAFRESLIEAVEKLGSQSPVLILADLLGGTPCNVALSLLRSLPGECVSGLNLPMLVEAIDAREEAASVEEVKDRCLRAGQSGIVDGGSALRQPEAAQETGGRMYAGV